MPSVLGFDWRPLFIPSGSLLELVIRGSIVYLLILGAMRVFRRDAGSLGTADLLVVVLVADAAQNGMAGEYKSITEGLVLVATIFAWDYSLDWLGYRYAVIYRILHPPPLLLIKDGQLLRRNLRKELLTVEDISSELREQGVERLRDVQRCFLEADGRMSIIRREPDHRDDKAPEKNRAM